MNDAWNDDVPNDNTQMMMVIMVVMVVIVMIRLNNSSLDRSIKS